MTSRKDAPTRDVKLQLMMARSEIDAIDDWRFRHRITTRAAAIRILLKRGMAADRGDTDDTVTAVRKPAVETPHR